MIDINPLIELIRKIYGQGFIPLHRPVFEGNERSRLVNCIDSNFVSSVGAEVVEFENQVADFVGSRYAIATVNGTAALHAGLLLAGVRPGNEVISQALTFVATCNAINYAGANPVFVDVDRDTLGMSPSALRRWLEENVELHQGEPTNRKTKARIAACVPMHTFGLPCRIEEIVAVCQQFGIPVVEDAAESLGSYSDERHTGTLGLLSTFSFNGNKIITTGGGGMIVTDDEVLAKKAKHLTTTAKVPHAYEFSHDQIGYNYRLPNLNATLGCAQMAKLSLMLTIKEEVATQYSVFCAENGLSYIAAPQGTRPNYWLNAIQFDSLEERNTFLDYTNGKQVMTRPMWKLMNSLSMFNHCQHDGLQNSLWLEERVVCLPSSVPEKEFSRFERLEN